MKYWPKTKILKSTGNAFDWKKTGSEIASDKAYMAANKTKEQMQAAGTRPGVKLPSFERKKS